MSIYKVNNALPPSTKIEQVNDMVFELDGKFNLSEMNLSEIDALYTGTSLSRKFKRDIYLGHNITGSGVWSDWTHYKAESGYSIWSYGVDNFKDNASNTMYLDDVSLTYMGEAGSAADTSAFDKVYTYNDSDYTDRTTEASTELGVSFAMLWTVNDYLYLGDSSTFNKVQFVFDSVSANYTVVAEYWNGSAWTTLSSTGDSLIDTTSDLISDGRITFDTPTDWATTTVNSVNKYWMRASTTSVPATGSQLGTKSYQITKADTVTGLLQLSNSEILNETWKWCYCSSAGTGSAYATIRSDGNSTYEGSYYIKSSSSDTNKQNYFVYNHDFKTDYQDSAYDASTALTFLYDVSDASGEVIANSLIAYSGSGIHPATALDSSMFATGACKSTAGTGASAKIQTFGKMTDLYTESNDDILAGDRLYLGTGAGQVTRTIPVASGNIQQLVAQAISNESSGVVDVILHLDMDYDEV